MRPGRLGTLVAAISVWLASHNGRLATVPRCPGCLLLPAGLLRSSQSPTPATSSTHHPAPVTIHRHEWKVSASLPMGVWIDWRHSCGHVALIVMVHPSRTIMVAMAGAWHHVPAGWYELAVRPYAVMLTCGFTSSSPAPIQASFSFILTCCEAQGW